MTWKSSKPKVAKVSKTSGGTITITVVGKEKDIVTLTIKSGKATKKIKVKVK